MADIETAGTRSKAVKPFLTYIGGKRRLAKRIIEMMPEHSCYVEPFGGMGAVLLAKPHSNVEVYNDIDAGLANVMRIVKYHPAALEEEMAFMLFHRAERKHWIDHPGETDIQRAARWIMARACGIQGKIRSGFYVSRNHAPTSRHGIVQNMHEVSRRLASVLIEHRAWQGIFGLYDSDKTLFFCDPPYYGDKESYQHVFTDDDHRELRDRLSALKGTWILTYNDDPFIRELYNGCRIDEAQRVRTLNQAAKREYRELIIRPAGSGL